MVDRMEASLGDLGALGEDALVHLLHMVFHFAVLSTKRPGFHEEREWRVMHSPTLHPSSRLTSETRCIGGVR